MTIPATARGGELIEINSLKSQIVRSGFDYWNALRGGRLFPARSDVVPRDVAGFLRHIVMLAVVPDRKDYLYRLVGDEIALAYSPALRNRHLSEIETELPGVPARLKIVLDEICRKGSPLAMRNWVAASTTNETFHHREAVLMPLGKRAGVVDHVFIVDAAIAMKG